MGLHQEWSVEEVELDGPKDGEVLVSFEATGLCHSDHHVRTGDLPLHCRWSAGTRGRHRAGSGTRRAGPEVGDHVVASFLPACGRCRWCSTGHQNLCDLGAMVMAGPNSTAGYRRHAKGRDIGALAWLGTFAQYGTVPETSLVKIDEDLPLSRACLVGCGVTTGWGSAVNTAGVSPGDTVVVIGCGGIGSGAIQGARLAGAEKIIAVDIAEAKRDMVSQFGATHFVTSMPEATALVAELTRGVMADSAMVTVGLVEAPDDRRRTQHRQQERRRRGDRAGVDARHDADPADVDGAMFTLFQKRLLGSLYGEANPRADIPRLLSLYREGKLLLDETVTAEYKLADINEAYDDMLAGRNIRGVIIHEH